VLVVSSLWEDGWWAEVWDWAARNRQLFGWLFVGSVASLVLCALLLPVVILRLPPDYFSRSRAVEPAPRSLSGWLRRVTQNVLGVIFLLAGVAMLVLPGQGVLTILIGLMLVDFPGKRGLERRIVGRPTILRILNSMRARRSLPPLIVD